MYISKIELRDWKAYESAEFKFPAPIPGENGKNIVLIGAPNGYGKTSLYQAIVLCMFGKDGMPLISNSMFSENENMSEQHYKTFLGKALHRGAIAKGRYTCSVKLVFIGDDGPVEIFRIWHFTESGECQIKDEVIQIFAGEDRRPVGPDEKLPYQERKLSSQKRDDWYRDYIARTFLPRSIVTFFVFDGEQVRVLAERAMKVQVRLGIEGLLGIPELRNLAENLKNYSKQRQNSVPNVTDENANATEKELKKLESKRDKSVKKCADISPQLSEAKKERDKIMDEFVRLGVGAKNQSNQQYKRLAEYEAAIKEGKERLRKLLSEDIALALSGTQLHRQLKTRMESENIRADWESGKQQGDNRIDDFLQDMDKKMDDIVPPISDRQQGEVLHIARDSWTNLWFPPPDGCAESYLHMHLSVHERNLVIDKLKEKNKLGAVEVFNLLNSISENENHLKQIRDEVARLEAVEPAVNEKRKRLKELDSKIEVLGKEADRLTRERQGLDGQVNAKNAELARMRLKIGEAQPAIRRAERARAVAAMVKDIIGKAVPGQIDKISDEMTEAHRSMAHKKDLIQRIEIDDTGDVKLLDCQGEDVRSNDLSAGEEQIFTQSLFSAVSAVSKCAFPMVVDTPLARLDREHRAGVLKHLAKRGEQVILLSTNTEVVDHHLDAIRPNILATYLIDYKLDDGIGCSTVTEGYFDESDVKT